MDFKDLTIAFLMGVVTNVLTFFITRHYTSTAERDKFRKEERDARAEAADAAVGHLKSSYYAVRQLALEVLDRQNRNKGNPEFDMTLWGIRHALEQMRLSLQGHMNAWKNQLPTASPAQRDIERIVQEDVIAGARIPPGNLATDIRDAASGRSVEKKSSDVGNIGEGQSKRSLVELIKESPEQRAMRMVAEGDVQGLEDEILLEAGRRGDVEKIVALGGLLSLVGSERVHGILVETMRTRYGELDADAKLALFTSIVQFYIRQNREEEGVALCNELAQLLVTDKTLQAEHQAHAYNQIGMLLHHAGQVKDAIVVEEKAMALSPNDAAYVCNHAQSYAALGDSVKAEELFEKALRMDGERDADHLASAVSFFRRSGKKERARDLLAKLKALDPQKAAVVGLFGDAD